MEFRISSWREKDGMVYIPNIKMYSPGLFYSYEYIDNEGVSNTREEALKRIDEYCKRVQSEIEFKVYDEYIVVK